MMSYIESLIELIGKFSRWIFVVIGILIAYEVVSRYVFNSPTIWVAEVSSVLQVWGVYLGLAYLLKHKRHITLDFRFISSVAWQRCVDSFVALVIIAFSTVVLYYGWFIWLKSFLSGHTTDSYLAIPKMYIQSAVLLGFGLLWLQGWVQLVRLWKRY